MIKVGKVLIYAQAKETFSVSGCLGQLVYKKLLQKDNLLTLMV